MTDLPPISPNSETLDEAAANELLQKLRQKQGNWVEWGNAIALLQKSGYNPQVIFEATGFEPVQQNQVVVGSQVFNSIEKGNAAEAVRSHFSTRGSDILYELRLLTHEERAAAAELAFNQKIDCDETKEVARAIKDFSRFGTPPDGFTYQPGDTVAYQCWKLAKQNTDLQVRSRLIARGLKYATSPTARQKIEELLVDFTVEPKRPAPTLPFYRLESEDELPRIVPVVGQLPLTAKDLQGVPMVEEVGSFRMVKFAGEQAWVPLPGWQVILAADDPVALMCESDRFSSRPTTSPESVLVVCDRADREWDERAYFVIESNGNLEFQWFDTAPSIPLLGKIIVILRPKRVLDVDYNKDAWQIDE
jgi:hypothetical protein